mmetsp:Transcript_17004/g.47089  ORF Transcript_17004/g.47089 Transcript_17004/m.47089 type:complete len:104 (-) Transcript_17004:1088-1399(-)
MLILVRRNAYPGRLPAPQGPSLNQTFYALGTSLAQSCVYVWGSGTKGSRAAMKSDMKRSTQKAEACACAAAAMVSRSAWSMMRSWKMASVNSWRLVARNPLGG